jgi:hypothetical protein
MNANGLARHYDRLTAWERLPLLLAALNRGDDAEAERLADAAPTCPAAVPHHFGLWHGLTLLSVAHQMLQMERAYHMACATALLGSGRVSGEEALRQLRMVAFRFVIESDAWKLLCAELRLDPEAILRHLPGGDVVRDMEEAARQLGFTSEEALAYLRSRPEAAEGAAGPAAAAGRKDHLDTAADLARGMREFLQERAQRWP